MYRKKLGKESVSSCQYPWTEPVILPTFRVNIVSVCPGVLSVTQKMIPPFFEPWTISTLIKINQVLAAYPQCSQLEFEKVIDAKRTKDGRDNTLFEVIFRVIPSHGIFGAAVKVEKWAWWFFGDAVEFSLVGEVERQNMYGNESICLGKDKLEVGWLRSACFCK